MDKYDIVKTTPNRGKGLLRRVTSIRTGRSYMVEREANKDWTCECRAFWNGIRVGADDPHCRHIKACIEQEKPGAGATCLWNGAGDRGHAV